MVVQGWVLNGGKMFGQMLSIHELSDTLGCQVGEIHDQMAKQMMGSKLWDKENQEVVINQVMGMSIAWALEDRLAIDHQVSVLQKSQGDSYKPFISSEVTKAIGLKVSSSNSLQSLVKGLAGGNTVNIFAQQNNQYNEGSVTIENAINIIQDQLSSTGHTPIEYIEDSGVLEGLPEVVATKQLGISTAKEGLNIRKAVLTEAMDDYKGATRAFEDTHHEIRREIMERIDPDEVDPETELY